jgi:hypothetical protein
MYSMSQYYKLYFTEQFLDIKISKKEFIQICTLWAF